MTANINAKGAKQMNPPVANPPVTKKAKNIPKNDITRAKAPCTPIHPNHINELPAVRSIPNPIEKRVEPENTTATIIAHVVFQGTTTSICHGIHRHQQNTALQKSQPNNGTAQIGLK